MNSTEAAGLLGVDRVATRAQIEQAYKRRARMSHPDRFTGASPAQAAAAAAEFIRITEARNLLLRVDAERRSGGHDLGSPGVTEPLVYSPIIPTRAVPRPTRAAAIWTALLFVANVFCVVGGTLPFSAWNLLLLLPLDASAIIYARSARPLALAGTLVFGAINAAAAVAIPSFGSLVALELLLAPVIALVVIGRSSRRRIG